MDKNAIKRGEWEPVLRHTVNLSASRTVPFKHIFITDAVDKNTKKYLAFCGCNRFRGNRCPTHRSVRANHISSDN
ncbi:hypothetical protein [Pediococcus acidilactici]|uniref:hypothetical protein n=1 Tax=Pediococcus acidilactici TaxID=1254 RepID=UPI003CF70A0B